MLASLPVIGCVIQYYSDQCLKQIVQLGDVNATDDLRKTVMRMPDHRIHKWKDVASDLREKRENPTLEHLANLLRKRVKAEFNSEFLDIQNSNSRRKNGIFADQKEQRRPFQCYMCSENHGVVNCPTFSSCPMMQNPACKNPPSLVFLSEPRSRDERMQIKGEMWYKWMHSFSSPPAS